MKLYLHIGTEKTGSSYLQTLCAINRGTLIENGCYFPTAGKREKDMLGGRISPGNADELSELIHTNSWKEVQNWLRERKEVAEKHKCSTLLLSNEILNRRLSVAGTLENFHSAARECGINSIKILLYIREPSDHALSLYRHRMKNGITKGFSDWLKHSYQLPVELADLFKAFEKLRRNTTVDVTVRKYSSKGNFMMNSFFDDWAGINSGELMLPESKVVNPSLNLSELLFLSALKTQKKGYEHYMYSYFTRNSTDMKADESELINTFKRKAVVYLNSFSTEVDKMNSYLPENEKLSAYRFNQNEIVTNSGFDARFSEAQLASITSFIKYSTSLKFKLNFMWSNNIKPVLRSFKRKLQ